MTIRFLGLNVAQPSTVIWAPRLVALTKNTHAVFVCVNQLSKSGARNPEVGSSNNPSATHFGYLVQRER